MTLNADDQALDVEVLNGEVVMTGPRVAIALRPRAASETARRLVAAADLANAGNVNCKVPRWDTAGPDGPPPDGSASNDT